MSNLFKFKAGMSKQDLKKKSLLVGLGAMKSGTSWLSAYLGAHPDFYHSPIKEMNYFNRLYDNPFKKFGHQFRMYRMEKIILDHKFSLFLPRMARMRLRALAQLGRLKRHEDFFDYFAERMGGETHFGEISPAYSHIPASGLRDIAGLTSDVKFIFLMRDPTERAASHIQHVRRRSRVDESIDSIIATIDPSSYIFMRSDYNTTLNAIEEAELGDACRTVFYETLFREETIQDLCCWLGLKYVKPNFKKRVNVATGESVTEVQKLRIRERLDPIYANLKVRFDDRRPDSWRW